jgi:integrase/recombinase XerD
MTRRRSNPVSAARQRSTLEGWLGAQGSTNTRAAYRADLTLFGSWCAQLGGVPLTADTATIAAFQAARTAAGDSSVTVRRRLSALSSFYDFAVDLELVAHNPTDGIHRPKVAADEPSSTAELSADAVAAYRAAAAAIDPRLDALVGLLVCGGLKVAEALALDVADIAGRAPTTTVSVQRRSATERTVLDLDTARALRRCIAGRTSGPVFVSERSSHTDQPTRLTRFGADHLIRQLRTQPTTHAGGQPVTANALRKFHLSTR